MMSCMKTRRPETVVTPKLRAAVCRYRAAGLSYRQIEGLTHISHMHCRRLALGLRHGTRGLYQPQIDGRRSGSSTSQSGINAVIAEVSASDQPTF
jgi:hypothetical protein